MKVGQTSGSVAFIAPLKVMYLTMLLILFPTIAPGQNGTISPPNLTGTAYTAPTNPYVSKTMKNDNTGECTWYVWGRTLESVRIKLNTTGNAKSFLNVGYRVDDLPSASSIAVWSDVYIYDPSVKTNYRNTGHVAYVERVDGSTIYFTEANVGGPGYQGIRVQPLSQFNTRHLNVSYPGAPPNPGPNTLSPPKYVHLVSISEHVRAAPSLPVQTIVGVPPSSSVSRQPVILATSASSVTATSATLAATINPSGVNTRYLFVYGSNSSLSPSRNTNIYDIGAGTSPLAISANIAGLESDRIYYFQVIASGTIGMVKGSVTTFHTPAVAKR